MSKTLFISYAREDAAFCAALQTHLSGLIDQGLIDTWTDGEIKPGSEWDAEIRAELEAAEVILLLISASFGTSKYIKGVELKRAMERHEAREAIVIPIKLLPFYDEGLPYKKLQGLPKNFEPIGRLDNHQAFAEVAEGIHNLVKNWQKTVKTAPKPTEFGLLTVPQKALPAVPDLSKIDYSNCLRPEATKRFVQLLFADRASLNIVTEAGQGYGWLVLFWSLDSTYRFIFQLGFDPK